MLPQPAPSLPGMQKQHQGGTRFPAPVSKAGGPIGTAVLFEDEEVRLWENKLPSGMDGPKHSHEQDYWIMMARTSPDRSHRMAASQEHNGWKRPYGPQGTPGVVFYVKKTGPEAAFNPPESPAVVILLCEMKLDPGSTSPNKPAAGTKPADPPAAWGASCGVIYENTEMKVWDMRVPPGQRGVAPVDEKNSIFHIDIRGKRTGTAPVKDLLELPNSIVQETFVPFPSKNPKAPTKPDGPKRTGRAYYRSPDIPETDPSATFAGEAINDGNETYRGLVIEMKPVDTPQISML